MPKGDRDILKADPEDGTTPIANLLLEALAMAHLSGEEKGAVLFLWRRTYGWELEGRRKTEDVISLTVWALALNTNPQYASRVITALTQKRVILRRDLGQGKGYSYSMKTRVNEWDKGCLNSEGLTKRYSEGLSKRYRVPSTKRITPPDTILAMPKESIKESIKEKGVENTPPIKTKTKSKPYQVEAGIFLDLVEQREDTKIINRGKAIKAARAIFTNYPQITPEKLYECFAWLRDNDSFLHNKEPPAIISFMPDKFPAWLAGKLQTKGGEKHGGARESRQRPKLDIEIIKSGEDESES